MQNSQKRKLVVDSMSSGNTAANLQDGPPTKLKYVVPCSVKLTVSAMRRMRRRKLCERMNSEQNTTKDDEISDQIDSESDTILTSNSLSPEKRLSSSCKRKMRKKQSKLKNPIENITQDGGHSDQSFSESNTTVTSISLGSKQPFTKIAVSSLNSEQPMSKARMNLLSPEQTMLSKAAKRRMRRGAKTSRTGKPREQTYSALLLNNLHPQSTRNEIEKFLEQVTGYNKHNSIYYIEVLNCTVTMSKYALICFKYSEQLLLAFQKFQSMAFFMGLPITVTIENSNNRSTYLDFQYISRYKKYIESIRETSRYAQVKFKQELFKSKSNADYKINEILKIQSKETEAIANEDKEKGSQTIDSTTNLVGEEANASLKETQNISTDRTQENDTQLALDVAIKTEQIDNENSNDSVKTTILQEVPQQFHNMHEIVPEKESVDTKPNFDTLQVFSIKHEIEDDTPLTNISPSTSCNVGINNQSNNIQIKEEPIDPQNDVGKDKADDDTNDSNKIYNAIQEVLSHFDINEIKEEPMDTQEENDRTIDLTSDENVDSKKLLTEPNNKNLQTAQLNNPNRNTTLSEIDKPTNLPPSEINEIKEEPTDTQEENDQTIDLTRDNNVGSKNVLTESNSINIQTTQLNNTNRNNTLSEIDQPTNLLPSEIYEIKEEPTDTQEGNDQTIDLTRDNDVGSKNVLTEPNNKNKQTLQLNNTNRNTTLSEIYKPINLLPSESFNNFAKIKLQHSTTTNNVNNAEKSTELKNVSFVTSKCIESTTKAVNDHKKSTPSESMEIGANISLETDSSKDEDIDESDENHCKILYFRNLPKKQYVLNELRNQISEANKEFDGAKNVKIQLILENVYHPTGEALVYMPTHKEAVHICKKFNENVRLIFERRLIAVSLDIGYKILKNTLMSTESALFNKIKRKLMDININNEDVERKVTKEIVDAFFDRGFIEEEELILEDYGFNPEYLKKMGLKLPLSAALVVQNLHELVDEDKLYEVFSLAGDIKELTFDKELRRAKIDYNHPVEAVQALHVFQGQKLFGKDIEMHLCKTRNPRPLPLGLSGIGKGLGKNGQLLKGASLMFYATTTTTQSPVFGSGTVFGTATTSASDFPSNLGTLSGAAAIMPVTSPTTTAQSVFGPATEMTQASVFGGTNPTTQTSFFGATMQPSVIDAATPTAQAYVFGTPTITQDFETPTPTSQASVFESQPATTTSRLFKWDSRSMKRRRRRHRKIQVEGSSGSFIGSGGSSSKVFEETTSISQSNSQAAAMFGGETTIGQKTNIELKIQEIQYGLKKINKLESNNVCAPLSAWSEKNSSNANLVISESSTSNVVANSSSNLNCTIDTNEVTKEYPNIQEPNEKTRFIEELFVFQHNV